MRLRVIIIPQLVGERAYKTFKPGLSLSQDLPYSCLESMPSGMLERKEEPFAVQQGQGFALT